MSDNKIFVAVPDCQVIERVNGYYATFGKIKVRDNEFFITADDKFYIGCGTTVGDAVKYLFKHPRNVNRDVPIDKFGFNHVFIYQLPNYEQKLGKFLIPNPFKDTDPPADNKLVFLNTLRAGDAKRDYIDNPLAPFTRAGYLHIEEKNLDEIEHWHDGIVLAKFLSQEKEVDGEKHTVYDVSFEMLESDYVKCACKEIVANNPNLDRIRIFKEAGTLFKDQGDFDQLNDYIISNEDLAERNSNPAYPDIDKYGKYIAKE